MYVNWLNAYNKLLELELKRSIFDFYILRDAAHQTVKANLKKPNVNGLTSKTHLKL